MPARPPTRPSPTTDPRLRRALDFERRTHSATGRVVDASWGRAFLHPQLDLVYDLNFLWAEGDAGGADAPTLAAAADRLLGGAGLRHRRVVLDPDAPATLRDGLTALRFGLARHLYLLHDGPVPPQPPVAVDVTGVEELLAPLDRYLQGADDAAYGRDDRVRAQLVEHARVYGAAGARERCLVVRDDDGAPVAWAKLWTRDGVAQVEDVVCLPDHRGRGYGRAVVAAATRLALSESPELVFIVADAEDWPKGLYERLGYVGAGEVTVHTRHDPSGDWAPHPPRIPPPPG